MKIARWKAGLAFAAAGAAAAAIHVWLDTPGALRDWRQTLPLAAALGFALGGGLRPATAGRGALVALAGMIGFAALFAAGHGAIEAARGAEAPAALALDAAGRALSALLSPAGAAAIAGGALAGAWLRRRRPRRAPP